MTPIPTQVQTTALDSLSHVIANKDSLLLALQVRLDSVLAAAPNTTVRVATPADLHPPLWYESGLVLTLLGGILGIVAGFGAQWFRGFLESRGKKKQLKRRILTSLGAAMLAARVTIKKDETHPIEPRPMEGLLEDWRRYDRVSDDLGLLGDPEIEDNIDAKLGFIRMVAAKVIAEEQGYSRTIRERGSSGPQGLNVTPEIQGGIYLRR